MISECGKLDMGSWKCLGEDLFGSYAWNGLDVDAIWWFELLSCAQTCSRVYHLQQLICLIPETFASETLYVFPQFKTSA